MSFQHFTTAPPVFFLGCQECPHCHEPVFAAEGAELVEQAVRYRWKCDLCGHDFTTETDIESEAA